MGEMKTKVRRGAGMHLFLEGGRYFGVRFIPGQKDARWPDCQKDRYVFQAGPGSVEVRPDEIDDLIGRLVELREAAKTMGDPYKQREDERAREDEDYRRALSDEELERAAEKFADTRRHLEVIADALAAPGRSQDGEADGS